MAITDAGEHQDEALRQAPFVGEDDVFRGPALRRGAGRRGARRGGMRRACLVMTAFVTSLLFLGLIGGGTFFALLAQGPIRLDIKPQIVAALNEKVGHGYLFNVGSTAIEATEHGPALTLSALSVSDAAGRPVITAPKAAISIDTLALMRGRIAPSRLEIRDVDVRLVILPDGQVAVAAGASQGAAVPLASAFSGASAAVPGTARPAAEAVKAVAQEPPTNAAIRALTSVLRSLVDTVTQSDSPLGSLDRVSVTGRLVLDDRTHGATTVFRDTVLSYDKMPDGSAVLQVAADGPAGRWSIVARASRAPDATKSLTVEVQDLSLDEITLAGGLRSVGFDFDMPVSASLGFHLAADGRLDDARGRFEFGSGYFRLDDPDHEPILVDKVSGGLHFDVASHRIFIESTTLRAGESLFVLKGHVDPPQSASDPWSIAAEASGTFGTERPGEKPIAIPHAELTAHVMPAERRLVIDRMAVSGPEVDYTGAVAVQAEGTGFRLKGTHTVKHMPAKVLVRLWPSLIAAPVRAWFLQNCHGGWVDSGTAVTDLTDTDIATMRAQHSVPDDHVRVTFDVSDLDLGFMPGVPALSHLQGSGVVTGHTVHFKAGGGEMEVSPGHKLTLAGGDFAIADSDPKPTPATIVAHAIGGIDTVADLLSRPALKPFANVPIDAASVHGEVDANLLIALRIGENVPPEDAKITVDATASNFSADKLIGKEGLADATMTLKADKSGIVAKGEGRIYGAPATIELQKPPGGAPSEAVVSLVLDDAARVKAGLNLGKGLSGIVTARVTTSLTSGEKSKAALDLDFTKATIDGLVPGYTKPAGRPAKATLTVLQHDGGATLDAINFEAGGALVRGSAEVDATGAFVSAKLSQMRLSPGDDLKVDANETADGLKLVVRGSNMDARPFLKWLGTTSSGGTAETAEAAKSIDVDLHANLLTGQNAQAINGADLRFSRRGGQIKRLMLTGKFGRQRLTVSTIERNGAPLFVINSGDAGASLSFLDLYKRMVGGRLDANLSIVGGHISGFASIHEFSLREDPAMRQLASETLASQHRNSNDPSINGATSAMTFTKLQGHFSRTGSLVEIRDAAFFGPQAGATVSGTLDFARDRLNLSGTYVPIYGVNNLFSQIPLFGPILGGGAHEGLFAVNFRITGSPTAPVLNVNPLSALAPGFLRKIFGAIDGTAEGQPRDRAAAPGEAFDGFGEPTDTQPEQE